MNSTLKPGNLVFFIISELDNFHWRSVFLFFFLDVSFYFFSLFHSVSLLKWFGWFHVLPYLHVFFSVKKRNFSLDISYMFWVVRIYTLSRTNVRLQGNLTAILKTQIIRPIWVFNNFQLPFKGYWYIHWNNLSTIYPLYRFICWIWDIY